MGAVFSARPPGPYITDGFELDARWDASALGLRPVRTVGTAPARSNRRISALNSRSSRASIRSPASSHARRPARIVGCRRLYFTSWAGCRPIVVAFGRLLSDSNGSRGARTEGSLFVRSRRCSTWNVSNRLPSLHPTERTNVYHRHWYLGLIVGVCSHVSAPSDPPTTPGHPPSRDLRCPLAEFSPISEVEYQSLSRWSFSPRDRDSRWCLGALHPVEWEQVRFRTAPAVIL